MEITGKTRCLPIIGHPVDEVFSPPAYNNWFRGNDVDCRMIALDLVPTAVAPFLSVVRASASFVGSSVTYPYKRVAFSHADSVTDCARRLGALNTLRREPDGRLSGDATDGRAMVDAIEARDATIRGASALVLGAGGGAGRAIADALCESGVSSLCLLDRDAGRRAAVASSISGHWPHVSISTSRGEAAILVNATTLGKKDEDGVPFENDQVRNADVVCDVVTRQGATRLIGLAQDLAKVAISGSDMGAAQLGPQLRFLGLQP